MLKSVTWNFGSKILICVGSFFFSNPSNIKRIEVDTSLLKISKNTAVVEQSICISYMSQPYLFIFGTQKYQIRMLNLVMHLLKNFYCCKWKQTFQVNKP